MRPCTMTRQGHSVSWESCKICLWEEKLSLCKAKKVAFGLGKKVVLVLGKPQFVKKLMC